MDDGALPVALHTCFAAAELHHAVRNFAFKLTIHPDNNTSDSISTKNRQARRHARTQAGSTTNVPHADRVLCIGVPLACIGALLAQEQFSHNADTILSPLHAAHHDHVSNLEARGRGRGGGIMSKLAVHSGSTSAGRGLSG